MVELVRCPLTLEEAAEALGICKRSLTTWLGKFPYYERRGVKKVFYEEHVLALRKAIHSCSESGPILKPASGKLAAPSGTKELEQARARQIERQRKILRGHMSVNTGNVVPMVNETR